MNYDLHFNDLSEKGFSGESRLCFQANDDYFKCIDDQNVPFEKINKFKCINELYEFEMYCKPSFITLRKRLYESHRNKKEIFPIKEQLDYLNLRSHYLSVMNVDDHNIISHLGISKL